MSTVRLADYIFIHCFEYKIIFIDSLFLSHTLVFSALFLLFLFSKYLDF